MGAEPLELGLRVVGPVWSRRRLVLHKRAFDASCAADPQAEPERESYLSAFVYGADLAAHVEQNSGSEKGFAGNCWSPWLWIDVDDTDARQALDSARRLVMTALQRYKHLEEEALLVFVSGSKGLHIGLPTTLFSGASGPLFHKTARGFAIALAGRTGVTIDPSVYSICRLFRAPNSRHPRSGLHKRRLSVEELLHLSLESICRLASSPQPFEPPGPVSADVVALADWQAALDSAHAAAQAKEAARLSAGPTGMPQLNRLTMRFIREGAEVGDRHRLLFSAAANLAEFGCPAALAHALLTESGLDSGLPPSEVHRQIECGVAHAQGGAGHA